MQLPMRSVLSLLLSYFPYQLSTAMKSMACYQLLASPFLSSVSFSCFFRLQSTTPCLMAQLINTSYVSLTTV